MFVLWYFSFLKYYSASIRPFKIKLKLTAKTSAMENPRDRIQIREQLDPYLEKALNNDSEDAFLDNAPRDPSVNQIPFKGKSFRNFIRSNVSRKNVSPDLIQAIRDKVRIV